MKNNSKIIERKFNCEMFQTETEKDRSNKNNVTSVFFKLFLKNTSNKCLQVNLKEIKKKCVISISGDFPLMYL